MKKSLVITAIATFLVLSNGSVIAEEKAMSKDKLQTTTQETVRGSQLMTQEEREEFRNKMRSATSAEERQKIQKEHHERMRARAKERHLKMSEEPPFDGMRGNMRDGTGAGMGQGGGRR